MNRMGFPRINRQSPAFVCFTGDLVCFTGDLIGDPVDKPEYLSEALAILKAIRAPLYGVPGNHEYWSKRSFAPISKAFGATGGAWLRDEQVRTHDGRVTLTGLTCRSRQPAPLKPDPKSRNILLLHYPVWVKELADENDDLILAGHSHGGQVRLPFIGAPKLAFAVDEYDKGLFQTRNGPLYVNPGIGWFATPIRFRCRPEITVIEL
jgi:predicted MPP superfamily phosphohydrolase